MPKQTWQHDFILRSIKILDIGYTTAVFGVPALVVANLLNQYIYPQLQFNSKRDDNKSTGVLLSETLLCLFFNGIVVYILRNILQFIPFPLEGVYGFKHMQVPEVKSGAIIGFLMLYMSPVLVNKLKALQSKLSMLV